MMGDMANSPSRMLKLLSLLQTRRDWPGRILSERLDISDRTLRRDIESLRNLGYQIVAIKGPDGGYRLDAGAELPPLLFDDDQAVALAVALQVAAASGALSGEAPLQALTTVRQVLPARLRHRIDAVAFTSLPTPHEGVDPAVLVAVSAAVRAHEILRFDYQSPSPKQSEAGPRRYHVEPHHVIFGRGHWYLVAWDIGANDWRVYRLDRMTPRIPTGPRFAAREVPGGDARSYLASKFTGAPIGARSVGRAGQWPCTGHAVLNLPARAVIPFAGDGIVEELDAGRCRLTTGSWSWVAMAALLGRFDTTISEVEPPELAEAFLLLAARFTSAAQQNRDAVRIENPEDPESTDGKIS